MVWWHFFLGSDLNYFWNSKKEFGAPDSQILSGAFCFEMHILCWTSYLNILQNYCYKRKSLASQLVCRVQWKIPKFDRYMCYKKRRYILYPIFIAVSHNFVKMKYRFVKNWHELATTCQEGLKCLLDDEPRTESMSVFAWAAVPA